MTAEAVIASAGRLGPIKTIHYAAVDDAVTLPRDPIFGFGERRQGILLPDWVEPFVIRLNELVASDALGPWEETTVAPPDLDDAIRFLSRVMAKGVPDPWVGLLPGGGLQMNWQPLGGGEIEAIFDRANNETVCAFINGDDLTELPIDEVVTLAEFFPATSNLLPFFAAV